MKSKFKFLIPVLLLPILGSASCSSGVSSSDSSLDSSFDSSYNSSISSSTSSNVDVKPITSVTYYVEASLVNGDNLNSLWIWNNNSAALGPKKGYFIKNIVNSEIQEVADREFKTFTLTVGSNYTGVCTIWDCTETIDLTIDETFFDGLKFLIRSEDGTNQSSNFDLSISNLQGDASVYYVTVDGSLTYYLDPNEIPEIPVAPVISEDLKSITFYYYRKNKSEYLNMNYMYFFSFDTKTVAVVQPSWSYVDFKVGNLTYTLAKCTFEFDKSYLGDAQWNFTGKSTITFTRELITGGILVRTLDGVYKTSDIKPEYDRVLTSGSEAGTIIYIDRSEYEWKSDVEIVYEPGDTYYSTAELTEALSSLANS